MLSKDIREFVENYLPKTPEWLAFSAAWWAVLFDRLVDGKWLTVIWMLGAWLAITLLYKVFADRGVWTTLTGLVFVVAAAVAGGSFIAAAFEWNNWVRGALIVVGLITGGVALAAWPAIYVARVESRPAATDPARTASGDPAGP